jgi:arylsulfatase
VALVALAGCRGTAPEPPRGVVLVSIDTLRADRLGVYGYPRGTSPAIDAIAADAVVFDAAVPTCPATAPSVASLLTGTYRARHGVRGNNYRLGNTAETLAERLRAYGFRTAARVANPVLDTPRGFGRGFDDYGMPEGLVKGGPGMLEGEPLVDDARALLDTLAGERFFLWIHFHDPHGPYFPPPRYRDRFSAADYRRDGEADLPLAAGNYGLRLLPAYQVVGARRAPADYRALYDAEIRYTDDHVAAVRDALRAHGLWDRIVFVLTADHGESLGEHDYYFQHGWFTYQDSVHVPLIVRAPGLPAGRRIPRSVSLIDVMPTILELAGVPAPRRIDGRSLLPLVRGAGGHRPAFMQTYYGSERVALRVGRFKYVQTRPRPRNMAAPKPGNEPIWPASVRHELYDLVADPAEVHDLADRQPKRLFAMARRTRRWLAVQETHRHWTPPRTLVAPDPEHERRLRALGYAD